MPEPMEPCSLLLVEDDPITLKVLSSFLTNSGHTVVECSNGKDAVHCCLNHDFDIIVLDFMLPHLNGLEFLANLRKSSTTPVIMISSVTEVDYRVEALEAGVDDFLVKPLSHDELLARIKAVRRRFTQDHSIIVQAGNLTIDLGRRSVLLNQTTIDLTRTEFELLSTLLKNRGRIVSRNFLQEKVFGPGKPEYGNIVDQYIMRVRRKLGSEIITTKAGLGFILNV